MNIFSISQNKSAEYVQRQSFKFEKELQQIVEKNLHVFFSDLEFVQTEFSFVGQHKVMRIDTLAFDSDSKSFVIIEYKRSKNSSVIDQGYSYLSAMLNHKADFVLAYNNKFGKKYSLKDICWEDSKIYFIAPEFTPAQKESVSFKDLPIFLWEINAYKNKTISIDRVGVSFGEAQIKQISKGNTIEASIYTEEELLAKSNDDVKEAYFDIKEALNGIANFDVKVKKLYVAFLLNGHNVIDIEPFGKMLKIFLNAKKGSLVDHYKLTRDISNVGHHGNGDYQISISHSGENFDKILDLVKQLTKSNE